MSDTNWAKLTFSLTLLAGCMLCLIGCSESTRSGPNTDWVQDDSLSNFETQANRPATAKTLWAMANILATQGKDSQCEFVLKRIIYEHPAFLAAYNSLAELKMRQGHTKAAIKTLQDGLDIDPEDTVLLNNLGMCWIILQDNEIALEMFTKAAGIMPENCKYRANMAVALGLMGRDEESLSLFNKVLPVDLANQNLAVLRKTVNEVQGVELLFSSDTGSFSMGVGSTLLVTISVTDSSEDITGFQLNFVNSDVATDELGLDSWTAGSSWSSVADGILNTPSDTSVAAGTTAVVSVPPAVDLGSFIVTAPSTPGDYLLTVNSGGSGAFDTGFVGTSGALTFEVFGDVIIHVIGNTAPVLDPIGDKTIDEETELTFTASATDSDIPANVLTFSLDAGAPAGAVIDPVAGVFTWTPTEDQGPGSYPVTVRVTDDGTPLLDDSETITITVNEVNTHPVLSAIGDKTVDEETELTFTASATDSDIPANVLTFSLDAGAPAGAVIDPVAGVFTWTPTEDQGPGSYPVTVRVTDDGTPLLDDFETITITEDSADPNSSAPIEGSDSQHTESTSQ